MEVPPCPQANSRYPNEKRKPGTERDSEKDLPFIARRPRRVLPTSFTGDVTLKLARTTGDEADGVIDIETVTARDCARGATSRTVSASLAN